MKKLMLLLPILFMCVPSFAQQVDSLTYQLQRKKVNGLLTERTAKFNQYFQSLDMHTGIFGLQTKKDIRRSNDILMDIVKTDNAVFKELKILLDYRTTVQTQVQDRSQESENRNLSYMNVINKLRNQLEKTQAEAAENNKAADHFKNLLVIAVVLFLALLFLFVRVRSTKSR